MLTASRIAGLEEALMMRKLALSGTEKTLQGCYSNDVLALRAVLPDLDAAAAFEDDVALLVDVAAAA